MSRALRNIIEIDEEKCDGCGLCVPSCKEGALQIVDGKARLVNEVYCDGLGACLGECPQGALKVVQREAEEFDEEQVALPCGCPGSLARSGLHQWPVQLALIPPSAPYLKGADLVLMADCTAFAYANAHEHFIKGKAVAIACPKLDDTGPYLEKLAAMIKANGLKSIEVVMMEVPCCGGLGVLARKAVEISGVAVELKETIISIEGEII